VRCMEGKLSGGRDCRCVDERRRGWSCKKDGGLGCGVRALPLLDLQELQDSLHVLYVVFTLAASVILVPSYLGNQ
jgi:hypothetical protein